MSRAGARAPADYATSRSEGRGYAGWRVVGTLAVTETVCWGVLFYTFTVVLLPMQADLAAGPGVVSGAFSLGLLVMGVGAIPVGRWVDRHGGRAVMTLGSLLGGVAVLAWSRVQDVAQLYAVFALLGLAAAMVLYEPAFAVVVQWFDRRRMTALLLVTVAAGFASTIFVPWPPTSRAGGAGATPWPGSPCSSRPRRCRTRGCCAPGRCAGERTSRPAPSAPRRGPSYGTGTSCG